MATKNLVLVAIKDALEDYAANPDSAYCQGRLSGLLSGALLGGIISSIDHKEFHARRSEISRAYSRKLSDSTGCVCAVVPLEMRGAER